ncbi:MAG: hypothetical protein ACFB4I_17565 [Cyanophyceae cyanobacterium]
MQTKEAIIKHLREHPNAKFKAKEFEQWVPGTWNHVRSTLSDLANEGVVNRERESHQRSPFLYFLDRDNSDPQAEITREITDETTDKQGLEGNCDPGSQKNGSQASSTKGSNQKKARSQDHKPSEALPDKENQCDPQSDPRQKSTIFFSDLKSEGSLNVLNRDIGNLHAETNYNQAPSLAKYKEGDRVVYVGDRHQSLKDQSLIVKEVVPTSALDFRYICQREGKPGETGSIPQTDLQKDET